MRKLTLRKESRDERGVTAVMVALMSTMLLAATGLGVDTAHVVYDDTRVQHSADAAALAIAADCARNPLACTNTKATGTANEFAEDNSDGGTGSITAGPSNGSVSVAVAKSVPTKFFGAFGIESKNVDAQATASWDNEPIGGTVLPFAMSLCEYTKHAVDTPAEIRTDLNDLVKTAKTYAAVSSHVTSCSVPADVTTLPGSPSSVSMLEGGLWMSMNGNNVCDGKVDSDYSKQYEATAKNETCVKKYEDDLVPNTVVFFPIYAPSANYPYAGISDSGSGDSIAVQIVGYAPFRVSGSCLENSCNRPGIFGEFIRSAQKPPEMEYGTGAGNFGAVTVKLTG